jgi:hypothetical protein
MFKFFCPNTLRRTTEFQANVMVRYLNLVPKLQKKAARYKYVCCGFWCCGFRRSQLTVQHDWMFEV